MATTQATRPAAPQTPRRMQHQVGDEVIFLGEPYTVSLVLELTQPPHPTWPVGVYLGLRRASWVTVQHYLVPAKDIEQPAEFAA